MGAERVLLKRTGEAGGAAAAAFVFFAVGALGLAPFALPPALAAPADLLPALPSGAVYTLAFLLYVAALREGEVTIVGPLGSANAIFVVALAAAVHHESLGPGKIAGTLLIVGGAAALQSGGGLWRGLRRLAADRPARRMLGYAVLLAATRMFDKAGAVRVPPLLYTWTVFAVISVLLAAGLAWRRRLRDVTACVAAAPAAALGAGVCNAGSFIGLTVALARLPVSLVEPLTAVSLLVSAVLARVWLGERLRARWVPTLAVIAGSWLLVSTVI